MDTVLLIEQLQKTIETHGSLPVIMATQAGSGEIDCVLVVFDTVNRRYEVLLQESL